MAHWIAADKASQAISAGSDIIISKMDTPLGPVIVPLPAPGLTDAGTLQQVSKKVILCGKPAATIGSEFPTSKPVLPMVVPPPFQPQAGILSGLTKGSAKFMMGSIKVYAENKPAVGDDSLVGINKGNDPMGYMNGLGQKKIVIM